jgi:DNA-binding NarL/FixJ family response regulator
MEKLRVFLVDDHPLIRMATGRILEADGRFSVVGEAGNAEDALRILETLVTDLVIMDIQLPGKDGVQATRELKARHGDLKVVILSAFGGNPLLPSIEAGADGYMLKGLAPERMAQSLLEAAAGMPPIDAALTRQLMDQAAKGYRSRVGADLSSRQQETLRMVSEGLTSKEIATRFCVSGATVKKEFTKIFESLGVNDRAHAVAAAYRMDLI